MLNPYSIWHKEFGRNTAKFAGTNVSNIDLLHQVPSIGANSKAHNYDPGKSQSK